MESFHGNSKREKERALSKVQRRGGICLTTYGLVVTSWEQLGQKDGVEFCWVGIKRLEKRFGHGQCLGLYVLTTYGLVISSLLGKYQGLGL